MKISTIKQQIKNPERASIFLDGKYAFSLSLNELVAERLKIGQEIDEAGHKRLKKLSDDGKLKARALEWVMTRPRSTREFKDYMYRKKAEREMIENLIEEFSSRNYLNETNFSNWLIDMRRRNGKSERAIRAELGRKGIPREIVQEVMEDNGDELARLREVLNKKSKLPRYKADPQKLMAYLARQGFSYDDIKQVLQGDD
jgi:regulatory protein